MPKHEHTIAPTSAAGSAGWPTSKPTRSASLSFSLANKLASHAREGGGVLVEFALVSLVLYLMVAAGFALGRATSMSQTAQDVARLAARELALYPLAAGASFEDALADREVLT